MTGGGGVRGQRYGPARLGKRYVTGGCVCVCGGGVGAQRYAPNFWKIHELPPPEQWLHGFEYWSPYHDEIVNSEGLDFSMN